MTGVIATLPKYQFSNALGIPMSGGTLTSYLAGTTTPTNTYQDEALSTANTNPISLDSRGECLLWLDSTKNYKFVLKNALGVTQWTVDDITGAGALADRLRTDLAASTGSSLVGHIASGTGAAATTAQAKLREIVSAKDFGATPAASAAQNSVYFQAAITYCTANNKSLYIPSGSYTIDATLLITSGIHIFGDRMSGTYITVNGGVSCFSISVGVAFVNISDLSIGQAVRYPTTSNTASAILINGTTVSQAYWHTYQNLFIDGFQTALACGGLSSSTITNVTTAYCKNGIDFYNQCLNNVITACHLVGGTTISDSFGVRVGDTVINCEGLVISDSVIYGFGRGVWINASINVFIHHNILDYCYTYGIIAQSGAAAACFNNSIENNYIAMGGTGAGLTGIYLLNNYAAADGQNNGTVVSNNEILTYPLASLDNGILIEGTGESRTSILGNRVRGCAVHDCYIKTGTGNRVANNLWLSTGFLSLVYVSYSNNVGTLSAASLITGSPQANTNSGSLSIPITTATTIFTLPARQGLYQITAYFDTTTDTNSFSASMLVFYNGNDSSPNSAIHSQRNGAGSNIVLSVSGGKNIQASQLAADPYVVYWAYIQIG